MRLASTKIKILLLSASTLLMCLPSPGQLPDGVSATQSWVDTIVKYYKDENAFQLDLSNISAHVKIPVEVHVIKNIRGTAGISLNKITSSVEGANSYFRSIGMQFFIDTVDYVNDYNYSCIRYNNLRK
jgi:hypothetical protein